MKKILLLFCLIVSTFLNSFSQNQLPLLWLRADQADSVPGVWADVSGNGYDGIFGNDTILPVDTLLNFNPVFYFDENAPVIISNLLITNEANNVIIVYEADSTMNTELPLWSFDKDSAFSVSLSTRRIRGNDCTIQYDTLNEKGSVINSLTQLWKKPDMPDSLYFTGNIANSDSSTFRGKIAELVVLPCSETMEQDTLINQWMSYLAVKYGITLRKMSYLSSDKTVTWNSDTLPEFSNAVAGLGRDDAFGLYQKQSYFLDNQIIIGLSELSLRNEENNGEMENGNFLMFGADAQGFSEANTLYLDLFENDTTVLRYGDGLAKITGENISQIPTFMQVDASQWENDLSSSTLLIDRSGSGNYALDNIEVYLPTNIDTVNNILYFNQIYWDTDGSGCDRFCFVNLNLADIDVTSGRSMETSSSGEQCSDNGNNGENTGHYLLYPNPNNGYFNLSAHYPFATPLVINIFTSEGKMVQHLERAAQTSHFIEGNITIKGQYLIEIITNDEKKTVKMIVQ